MDDLEDGIRGSEVSGGGVIVVEKGDVDSFSEEALDDVLEATSDSDMEQGVALIVDVEQETRSVGEEDREGRETVMRDGKEGGVAVGERLDKRVSAVPQKCADHLSIIFENGPVKGCEVLLVNDIEAGVFFEELLDDILVSRTCRKVQRCLSVHVL